MTDREKEILDILIEDPMVSQQALADMLNITRSSVAVHITNLMKKGHIKGKGYIISKSNFVTVIGGSNIDIQGSPNNTLTMFDSNPGNVDISLGGVGRNICENIAKLGLNTKLLSAVGNDIYGNKILSECKQLNIDTSDCYISDAYPTSMYLSILNSEYDMQLAISHMDIIEKIDIDYIVSKHNSIRDSLAIVLDTNLSFEVIDYITRTYTNIPIFVDTVSTQKSLKIKDIIGKFNTIKPNKLEAEILSGIQIKNEDDLNRCAEYFLSTGVKNVFITLGQNGVFCANENESLLLPGVKVDAVNATGAGDAFISALVYSYLNNFNLKDTAKFSTAASILTLLHKNTINPSMSVDSVEKILKEMI
ncbi:MAG: PfkB family carbohydrate kinase [Paraclostridium sp.]|uniref:PfkB family carbohydrate kinase n=1 Tax=Paraclostridium sp. TaxID=2023273 RepID=UPI00302C8E66